MSTPTSPTAAKFEDQDEVKRQHPEPASELVDDGEKTQPNSATGSVTDVEEIIVDFDGPDDPANPKKYVINSERFHH